LDFQVLTVNDLGELIHLDRYRLSETPTSGPTSGGYGGGGYSPSMSKIEKVVPPETPPALNWTKALSSLTALVAIGTVTLHLIGDLRHRHYLKFWGIDAGLFPKTTDWILINGYYGAVDRFVAILTAMLGNLSWMAVAAVILGLYVFILLSPVGGSSGKAPAWLLRQPPWRLRLIQQMLLTAAFVAAVPCALFLLIALMVVPAALGEAGGKISAEKEASEYRKGCLHSKIPCVEVKAEAKTIATGFVLDSSLSRIAIFDAQLQRARVIELEKLELISGRTP
jgi:hypothetical protein